MLKIVEICAPALQEGKPFSAVCAQLLTITCVWLEIDYTGIILMEIIPFFHMNSWVLRIIYFFELNGCRNNIIIILRYVDGGIPLRHHLKTLKNMMRAHAHRHTHTHSYIYIYHKISIYLYIYISYVCIYHIVIRIQMYPNRMMILVFPSLDELSSFLVRCAEDHVHLQAYGCNEGWCASASANCWALNEPCASYAWMLDAPQQN